MTTKTMDEAQRKAAGKAIYETQILPLLKPEDKGKHLVLDITTGDYAIHPFSLGLATELLLDKRPDAILHSVRIGHDTVARIRSPRKILVA